MDIIGLYYYNITHAKIILTEQNAYLIIYLSRNKNKMHEKYQYNRLDATPKIGFYRLPTHRRGDHRKYFSKSLLILNQNFDQTELIRSPRS